MPMGICKGCKKFTELNSSGYCNVGNTLNGACSAESFGSAAAEKLIDIVERWASQYVSRSTFKIILTVIFVLAFFAYQSTRKN